MARVGFHVIRVRTVLRWAAVIGIALAAGLLLYGLAAGFRHPAAHPGLIPVAALPLDQPAPDFALTAWDGRTIQLAALKGQPVVLVFWTTWCPGCREGLAALEAVYRQFRETHGLAVLAVNIMETPEAVEAFLAQKRPGWSFPVLLDRDGAVSEAYRIRIAPSVMFIDKDGLLRDRLLGEFSQDLLAARLQPLLPRTLPAIPTRATGLT
ncbi:MAG TPA: TlpA disulfide reductase family protein [Limnochordales bacterium]|nr:TlpA disulfide reductase family protein [Limnochordales bacterium]